MSRALALTHSGSGGGGRRQLEKASLQVYEASPAGGGGYVPGAAKSPIAFQFNPKELSLQKAAGWKRDRDKQAARCGPPEFLGSDPCKLTVEMFFDATDTHDGSVVAAVEALLACCVPTVDSRDQPHPMPPLVRLSWGEVTGFPAVITSVSAKYTVFTSDGTPIRALCTVALEEMPGPPPNQNPTSGALATRRSRTLVEGDSLASVAYREYGDPGLWRALASFNGVDDPLRLPRGLTLLVPAVEELSLLGEG